jgi:tetratricopeptide (TPR) repeat protein
VVFCFAVAVTGMAHGNMDTTAAVESGELFVPDPERARLSALGFAPVVADYYWVQTLWLVGGTTENVEAHAGAIADLIELVTALDPWVDHPYRFAAVWLTRSAEEVRRANRLLHRAISYHPQDWRNRFYLGYNHFFYLEDNRRAADVLEPAVPMQGAPLYLGAFVSRLRADGGSLETAAAYLRELIRSAPDEYSRAEYLKAYDEIETERRARYLDEARVAFWERRGRDIRAPDELWQGPKRVIQQMPPAHPHFSDFVWLLDEASDEIVSSFYRSRYKLHIHPLDAERRARWRAQLEAQKSRQEEAATDEVGSEGSV